MREVWIVERRDDNVFESCCTMLCCGGVALWCYSSGGKEEIEDCIPPGFSPIPSECDMSAVAAVPVAGPFAGRLGHRVADRLRRTMERFALDPLTASPSRRSVLAPRALGLALIAFYRRRVSPLTPARCPFRPTCSAYGYEAVRRYGLLKGTRVILHRLSRCRHSVAPGTPDPLP